MVAAGLSKQCQVRVVGAIGVAKPMNVTVYTSGTGVISDDKIAAPVNEHFSTYAQGHHPDARPAAPDLRKTAAYGHFGREEPVHVERGRQGCRAALQPPACKPSGRVDQGSAGRPCRVRRERRPKAATTAGRPVFHARAVRYGSSSGMKSRLSSASATQAATAGWA